MQSTVSAPSLRLTEVAKSIGEKGELKAFDLVASATGDALEAVYTRDVSSDKQLSDSLNYLKKLAGLDRWLACHCCGEDLSLAPVLYPQTVVSSPRITKTLVRHPGRPEHSTICPFRREREKPSDGPSTAKHEKCVALGVLTGAGGSEEDDEEEAGNRRHVSTTSSSAAVPRLARVLFTLLEKANRHILDQTKRSLSNDKGALKNALPGLALDKLERLPASKFIEFSLHSIGKFSNALSGSQSDWAAANLEPHGFVIDEIGDVEIDDEGRQWLVSPHSNKDRWEVRGRLRMPGAGTVGPYVVIALVCVFPGEPEATIAQAYVHPIYTLDHLYVIDSGLERQTLTYLLLDQKKMAWAHKPYTIIKPLIDLTEKGRCRPDFILDGIKGRLLVETMGYTDPAYRDRKARTHEVMKEYGKLLEHNEGCDKEFVSELKKFLG